MIEAPAPFPAEVAKIPRGAALRRGLRANPLLVVGAVASACIVVVALLAPLLAPFPGDAGTATHPFTVLHAPSAQHWFGTDNVGRDILSRVLYGARISPLIAFIVLLIAGAIGIPLGLAAGYFGGWLDEVIMRVTVTEGRGITCGRAGDRSGHPPGCGYWRDLHRSGRPGRGDGPRGAREGRYDSGRTGAGGRGGGGAIGRVGR